jgi:transposase
MVPETTTTQQYTAIQPHLYIAFELSQKKWLLGFTIGFGQKPRLRTIAARDLSALQHEIRLARQRFDLADDVQVVSCYEAGRDGFWLHRYLLSIGVTNLVVDSASIEVNRRARQSTPAPVGGAGETDRLDLGKLLTMLTPALHRTQCGASVRYHAGEKKVWSVVHVPSPTVEDNRHLHRELADLKAQRTQHSNRIKGYLANQGICLAVRGDFPQRLKQQRLWNGEHLPAGLQARLLREYQRFQLTQEQIKVLETERKKAIRSSSQPEVEQVPRKHGVQVRQLLRLRGIGDNSAWLFVMEFFAWRAFRNRREVGALAGLTPFPHQSGEDARESGISKVGNRHIRAMAIEIAWIWLRFQPDSELSRWYQRRFEKGSKRLHKIGIVALARKLLIELWRYLETGRIPPGAVLKPS